MFLKFGLTRHSSHPLTLPNIAHMGSLTPHVIWMLLTWLKEMQFAGTTANQFILISL